MEAREADVRLAEAQPPTAPYIWELAATTTTAYGAALPGLRPPAQLRPTHSATPNPYNLPPIRGSYDVPVHPYRRTIPILGLPVPAPNDPTDAGFRGTFPLPTASPSAILEALLPSTIEAEDEFSDSSSDASLSEYEDARSWLSLGARHAARLRSVVHPRTATEQTRADIARSTGPYLHAESLGIIEGLMVALQRMVDRDGRGGIVVDQTVEVAEVERAETGSDRGSLPPREIGECPGDAQGNNRDCECQLTVEPARS